MIPEIEIILRIIIAGVLGGLVGIERERQNQPAGLRTHIILVIGAALAMALSINLPIMYKSVTQNGDPTRLAAQVISGIGFLGAGAILRLGPNVRGLTTATSLWSMAIVGLAVGAGYYLSAIITTILLLMVLFVIHKIEERLIRSFMTYNVSVKAEDSTGLIDKLKTIASTKGNKLALLRIKKNLEENRISVEMEIRASKSEAIDKLVADLSLIEGIKNFEIN